MRVYTSLYINRAILTIVLVILVIPESASTIFYEGFSGYAPGELAGKTGGTGWAAGGWAAVAAPTEVVNPGTALTYSVPGGGIVAGGNSALQVTGDNDSLISRMLDGGETGDVFFSFLYRQSAGSIITNDFLVFWFDNDNLSGNTNLLPNIGEKANRGNGSGVQDFMARGVLGSEVYSPTQFSMGSDFFIVGRLFKSASVNYNRFSLWVNPTAGGAASPDAIASFGGGFNTFLRLGVRSVNLTGDVIYVDELRAGTTFNDVINAAAVPIPEPTTLALLGLGLIGLGLSRRNRSRV